MYELTLTEQNKVDAQLERKLEWARTHQLEAEQLALDATRLLSCTADRLEDYRNQGFFKRCWYSLSGKNGDMQRANQHDLLAMQQYSWRYINLLNERNILLAHSMITVKNNLLTLAIKEEETRNEIKRMAEKVYDRFVALEDRMHEVEVSTNIHRWLLTLDTLDYDERYTPYFRLLRIVNDFILLKDGNWSPQELRYLQKAVKEAGLPWKQPISIMNFVVGLINEINGSGQKRFEDLLRCKNGIILPASFILENISTPTYASLFSIVDNYSKSSNIIEILAQQLNCSKDHALKRVILNIVVKQGVDIKAQIPLRDLAIELLSCTSVSRQLFALSENESADSATSNSIEFQSVISNNIQPDGHQMEQLSEQAFELLPEVVNVITDDILATVFGDVSNMIDEYVENEEMEPEEFASYFSAEHVASLLEQGMEKAVSEILEQMASELGEDYSLEVDSKYITDSFRFAATKSMKPYLNSILVVEKAGATFLNAQPSTLASLTKGAGVGVAAAALLGPVGILAAMGANYLHDSVRVKSAENALDEFNACVESSLNAYDQMVSVLSQKTTELINSFMVYITQQLVNNHDVDKLGKFIIELKEAITEC
ncbi:MAG: hypothetical protein E6Q83_03255 [Thiothrix sp.]|nr:MAG: hypothetical protein E6Q83_03255 [Thiothrix sp.]